MARAELNAFRNLKASFIRVYNTISRRIPNESIQN